MFQQDSFVHVVFSLEELRFWNPNASANTKFPALVNIVSKWEEHSILLRLPDTSRPEVAPRREGWEESMIKAERECLRDLRCDIKSEKTIWWNNFFGTPEKCDGIYQQCPVYELWTRQLNPFSSITIPTASATVQAQSVTATVGPVMRSTLAANENRLPVRRSAAIPIFDRLTSSSFAFVNIEGGFCESTGLKHCVVQLPDFATDVDTTNPQLDIKVRWWKPQASGTAAYGGKWVIWFKESSNQQYVDKVKRCSIAVCPLELHASSNVTAGSLSSRWLKPKASPTRLLVT